MNPPPTGGSITSIISGPLFVRQLAHGLVRKSADYVTFLNTFVLESYYNLERLRPYAINIPYNSTYCCATCSHDNLEYISAPLVPT